MNAIESMSVDATRCFRRWNAVRCLFLLCAGLGLGSIGGAQTLQNHFTNRMTFTSAAGDFVANNASATVEPGEPLHGGKRGGHSMWISWVAPTNCIVRFQTEGSGFDTLLAAYRFRDPGDTSFDQLQLVSSADDSEGFESESQIEFGATGGHRYEIAVDGYFGATGNLELSWGIVEIDVAPPVILSVPTDRSARLGGSVQLSVTLTNLGTAQLRWYLNGVELNAFTTNLFIPNLQPAKVGRYQLRVFVGGDQFFVPHTDVQINTEGAADTLARDKTFDALANGLVPEGDGFRIASGPLITAASSGVSRGYNGSQVFNTLYATPDPSEPRHCDLAGGASYWYAYTPPADGTLVLDSIGSAFDTYLAVYTYDPPLTGYGDLIPIACDNDSAGTNHAARLEFAAPKNRTYFVVLDGINGARGMAQLNYRLDTNRPPVAPTLVAPQAPLAAAAGTSIALQPAITGSMPLRFLWRMGDSLIQGATNHSLLLADLTPAHSGDYRLTVSSHVGAPLLVSVPLRVLIPPPLELLSINPGALNFSFPSIAGQEYLLDHAPAPDGPWQTSTNVLTGTGEILSITHTSVITPQFFRLKVR